MNTVQDTYVDPNEPHILNFVPDEICIVAVASNIDQEAEPQFYQFVRNQLNRQIAALLKAGDDQPDSPLESDLAPTVLRRRFGSDRAVLQPLRRPARRVTSTSKDTADDQTPALNPWVRFRRASGRDSHHLYFQLGSGATRPDRAEVGQLDIARESVRELTLLLNRSVLSTPQLSFENQPWLIQAVAPNWVTVAHQFACGGPAGLPVPVQSRTRAWPFRFRGALATVLDQPARGDVIVAVLDTCPSQRAVDTAAASHPGNALLGSVQHDVKMNTPALVPDAAFGPHLAGCLPRLQWDMRSGPVPDHPQEFALADHGLFISGVIYDIVDGRSKVFLSRVLNDFLIGDVFSISHALAILPRALLGSDEPRPGEPRLVVNLSLGIDLPIPARLLDRWLPRTAKHLDSFRDRLPDICAALEMLHGNMSDAIAALGERGALIVASAGNDALRRDVQPGAPPPPRFPARYDDVLGVAATRRDLNTASNYSNRGELATPAWPGDVATFGGNLVPPGVDDAPGRTDPSDGVVGIFSARAVPATGKNTSGFVRWAGTSFAAPIVSGVAARLWGTNPGLQARDVIAWVQSFARHPHPGAHPDAPLNVPVIDVSQR